MPSDSFEQLLDRAASWFGIGGEERSRFPFAGPEFLLQPLVPHLQMLDLPLQFFDLFRLPARMRWFGPIHPPSDKRTPPICPETSDGVNCPLINYDLSGTSNQLILFDL